MVKGTRRGATTEMSCRCFESDNTPALAEGQLPKNGAPAIEQPNLAAHLCYRDLIYAAAGEISLPSGVATMLRTTPPPDGIGVGEMKVCVFGSKPTIRFGATPVSAYQTFPSGVAVMA
jgi:hypothetical protein